MASTNFTIEPANPSDIDKIMSFFVPAFRNPAEQAFGRLNTPEGRKATGEQHLHAWKLHAQETDIPCALTCVHTDPTTGQKTIVGFCEWFIYPHTRPEEEYTQVHYLASGDWLPAEQREVAKGKYATLIRNRVRWMAGRPVGFLMYMVVHPEWRRKGASTMLVNWGLEKCAELGIPAHLDASPSGAAVYEKLGFEQYEAAYGLVTMIRWPEGTDEKEKVMALPEWDGAI